VSFLTKVTLPLKSCCRFEAFSPSHFFGANTSLQAHSETKKAGLETRLFEKDKKRILDLNQELGFQ
jgi:hypothetical protein